MSQENVEVVRTHIGPNARLPTRRTLDERVYVRWPGLYTALSRAGSRLPPRSRLRRAGIRRNVLSGWAAWQRVDLDLVLLRYTPDCEWWPTRDLIAVGLRNCYHGHAGVRELIADWREAWDRIDLVPQEILDAGNPVIVTGRRRMRARGSGIEFDRPLVNVYWTERGLNRCQRDFADRNEALRAAGITAPRPDAPVGLLGDPWSRRPTWLPPP